MGCWNETDALTKLPILEGDEAVMIVLESAMDRFFTPSRFVNENLYVPASLPLYGTYDDCGSLDLHEDKKEYHRLALQGTTIGSDTPQEFLEQISYDDVRGQVGGIYTKMFFSRSVWEDMLVKMGDRVRRPHAGDENFRQHFESLVDECIATTVKPSSDLVTQEINRMQVTGKFSHTYRFVLGAVLRSVITPEVREGVVRLALTDCLLSALRLGWAPQFGSGSQDVELDLTADLAGHIYTGINGIRKRMASY